MNDASNAPAIQMHDLHKSFGDQRVLQGVTLEVGRGHRVAILGRSGTGKSVLLKILIGLQKPDRGSVHVNGTDIGALSRDELNDIRKQVGFVFQNAALYDSMTVEENVAFPLRPHRLDRDSGQGDRVRALLSSVGLENESRKMPAEISGGMKKRVALARALALEPALLLFDEPTAGLDPITAAEIAQLILKVNEDYQATSVFVTHDLRSARAIADRLVLLHEGAIIIDGTFEDLQQSTLPLVTQYLKQGC